MRGIDRSPPRIRRGRRKVLVIDDSNTIRRSAEIFLRQGGHEVLLAEDGFDALAKVNDHRPI
jgi:twitching motility two-component system response regulator PilG